MTEQLDRAYSYDRENFNDADANTWFRRIENEAGLVDPMNLPFPPNEELVEEIGDLTKAECLTMNSLWRVAILIERNSLSSADKTYIMNVVGFWVDNMIKGKVDQIEDIRQVSEYMRRTTTA